MMIFDSEVELMKVVRVYFKVKLVLWIVIDDFKVVCCFSVKFGVMFRISRFFLEWVKELNIDVVGVSFYVGSGCIDFEIFVQVIFDVCCVFDMGVEVGFSMYLFDIGGGFFGFEDVKFKFEEIIGVINLVLDKYFLLDFGVRIIVEFGRYYVVLVFMFVVNIIVKKIVLKEQMGFDDEDELSEQIFMYYVNDGVYGLFNCIFYDYVYVKFFL